MAILKNNRLYVAITVLISLALVNTATAGMGAFGGGKTSYGSGKEKTAEEKYEERKKRKPAKMADVLWDKKTQGMLRVFCKPKANLFVDGEIQKDQKGKTRKSEKFAIALTVGTHVIKMERDGFEPQERQLVVEAGKPYSMNFVLIKKGLKRGEMVLVPAEEF
jgi:hypothetical protein